MAGDSSMSVPPSPEAQAVETLRAGVHPAYLRKALAALEAALEEKDERIAKLDRYLAASTQDAIFFRKRMVDAEAALKKRDERIAELDELLAEADAQAYRYEAQIARAGAGAEVELLREALELARGHSIVTPIFRKTGPRSEGAEAFERAEDIERIMTILSRVALANAEKEEA
jgi:chromosome segregation ATPase